jgi:hypothetical protein
MQAVADMELEYTAAMTAAPSLDVVAETEDTQHHYAEADVQTTPIFFGCIHSPCPCAKGILCSS